jgi:hypothetical protein
MIHVCSTSIRLNNIVVRCLDSLFIQIVDSDDEDTWQLNYIALDSVKESKISEADQNTMPCNHLVNNEAATRRKRSLF